MAFSPPDLHILMSVSVSPFPSSFSFSKEVFLVQLCNLVAHHVGKRKEVAATIFGCDLGPNLTTVGSLATILWLLILRQRNLDVSGLDYFKVGIMVTPFMLVAGALAIWLLLG